MKGMTIYAFPQLVNLCKLFFRQLNIVLELSIWIEEKNSKQKAEFDMNTVGYFTQP